MRGGVHSFFWATGYWTHIVTFTGPSETRFLGWRAPASILSQAPSAPMSRVASSRPKGRAGTGRKPRQPAMEPCEGKLGVALESLQGLRDLT